MWISKYCNFWLVYNINNKLYKYFLCILLKCKILSMIFILEQRCINIYIIGLMQI